MASIRWFVLFFFSFSLYFHKNIDYESFDDWQWPKATDTKHGNQPIMIGWCRQCVNVDIQNNTMHREDWITILNKIGPSAYAWVYFRRWENFRRQFWLIFAHHMIWLKIIIFPKRRLQKSIDSFHFPQTGVAQQYVCIRESFTSIHMCVFLLELIDSIHARQSDSPMIDALF